MAPVLILGNGISRLLHEDMIREWTGELWACNYAYYEWGEKITLLAGHSDVLQEARAYREKHGLSFVLYGGLFGAKETEREATTPGEFRKDSGSSLVAQALEDGYNPVLVCGFDMGGPDLLSPALHLQKKSIWVRRWRNLLGHYGPDRIRFVGFNHKPFLLGRGGEAVYYNRYRRGVPHIPDPAYIALHNLLYGSEPVMRGEREMKVEFIKGNKAGFITHMSEPVAMKYLERGAVKILEADSPAPLDETEEGEITADTRVTSKMSKGTLVKIAALRGVDGSGINKAGLYEMLKEE